MQEKLEKLFVYIYSVLSISKVRLWPTQNKFKPSRQKSFILLCVLLFVLAAKCEFVLATGLEIGTP